MRNHSLQLSKNQFTGCYQSLKKGLADSDVLKRSFLATADNVNETIDKLALKEIDERIEFIASKGVVPESAMLLFGMISFLDQNRAISHEVLIDILKKQINTENSDQKLSIQDGTWEVSFVVGSAEFRFPKYNYELKEIVPESIIEIFHSVVLCLQSGLNIAAMSLALVALETTVWDHLALKGIKKETEFEKYPHPVVASISWEPASGYQVSISDKDANPKAPSSPVKFDVEFRRTGIIKKQGGKLFRDMVARVEDQFSLILSDETDKKTEIRESLGLSVALERARKEGLLDWNPELDKTFHTLRNKLIHQATDYEDIDIFTPHGKMKLGDISKNMDLTLFFINRIKDYISNAYYAIRVERLPIS